MKRTSLFIAAALLFGQAQAQDTAPQENKMTQGANIAAGVAVTAGALGGLDAGSLNKVLEATEMIKRVNALSATATAVVTPPAPRADAAGSFVSPYRQDGTLTPWADKALTASVTAVATNVATDKAADAATNALASKVPFGGMVGGLFGKKAKEKAKEVAQSNGAMLAVGGEEAMRGGSDTSFNSAADLAVYLQSSYATREDFPKALAATIAIYPEMKTVYEDANQKARGQ